MKTRMFGRGGPAVSEVGLGAWQFGGEWGDVSDETARAVLEAAADAGVSFIDTADVYGAGRSERLVGELLASRDRSAFFVATKLGRLHGYPDGYDEALFRRCTEESAARLGVDCIDLTQLHCVPPEALRAGDVFRWLRALKDDGLIRAFGASVESMDEAMICLEQEDLASLQVIFNAFRQKPAEVLFEKARARGVALIVRLPLASGLLSGRFSEDTAFAPKDHRSFNRDGARFNVGETFSGLPYETGVHLARTFVEMAPPDMTPAQAALRWILDHEAVTVVIPGASRPEQARENALVSELPPLGTARHARLAALYAESVAPHIRGPY